MHTAKIRAVYLFHQCRAMTSESRNSDVRALLPQHGERTQVGVLILRVPSAPQRLSSGLAAARAATGRTRQSAASTAATIGHGGAAAFPRRRLDIRPGFSLR